MKKRVASVVLILAAGLTGGCLGGAGDIEDDALADANATADPQSHVAYLGPDGSLQGQPPGTEAVAIGWSWQDWVAGRLAPMWTSEPFAASNLITGVNVTLAYRAEQAVLTTASRPRFTMWFGAGHDHATPGIIEHGFADGPDIWLPGTEQTVTFPVDLPLGGLAVDAGMRLVLHVGTYYPDGDQFDTISLVLGESRVDWVSEPAHFPAGLGGDASTPRFEGELTGGRCIAPANPENTAHARHTFDVPNGTSTIDLLLERIDGTGTGPDMDMFVEDADGTLVAYAMGSSTPEAIHLRQPNIEPATTGTWTLNVYNCQPQYSTYQVSMEIT